eukprot:36176_1
MKNLTYIMLLAIVTNYLCINSESRPIARRLLDVPVTIDGELKTIETIDGAVATTEDLYRSARKSKWCRNDPCVLRYADGVKIRKHEKIIAHSAITTDNDTPL